jgi:hypothetical protein
MTTLIANLGTSDLAVKLEGFDYYVPIGFNRKEPNISREGLTNDEKDFWENREVVAQLLCEKLNVKYESEQYNPFSFVELTQALWRDYQVNPKTWQHRLCLGRIGGVLQAAKEKNVKDVYLFVTKQEPTQPGDTYYLFEILKNWIERQDWQLNLHPVLLDPTKKANDLDLMIDEYYKFFRTLNPKEDILVSILGGTPQMQTALKVQTISSGIQHLLLEPQLSVKTILAGEYSSCKVTSYWQYRRSQEYRTVELLLSRYDFDGAREVLKNWRKTLQSLKTSGVENQDQISTNEKTIHLAIAANDMAIAYFNLDESKAQNTGQKSLQKSSDSKHVKHLTDNYDKLLNLYTTCRIFWKFNQIANFLPRLGSFCEEMLHQIFIQLDGEQYFDRDNYPHDWYLDSRKVDQELFELFTSRENQTNQYFYRCNFNQNPNYRLPGRFSKRNFAEALVIYRRKDLTIWQELINGLEKLDYWVDKRNEIIHSGKGVSKQTMAEILVGDRQAQQPNALAACDANDVIISEITKISRNTFALFGKSSSSLLNFVGNKAPYYIYDEIAEWIRHQLNTQGLE